MTNQPPQWLVDELSKMSARWYDERFTPLEAIDIAATAITARVMSAIGEDEPETGERDSFERLVKVAMNAFRGSLRQAFYTEADAERKREKNETN